MSVVLNHTDRVHPVKFDVSIFCFSTWILRSLIIADNGHNISRQTDSERRPQRLDQNAAQ